MYQPKRRSGHDWQGHRGRQGYRMLFPFSGTLGEAFGDCWGEGADRSKESATGIGDLPAVRTALHQRLTEYIKARHARSQLIGPIGPV